MPFTVTLREASGERRIFRPGRVFRSVESARNYGVEWGRTYEIDLAEIRVEDDDGAARPAADSTGLQWRIAAAA